MVLLASKRGDAATDVVAVPRSRLRELRGTDVAMVFQEPSTALNPVYTVGWQIAEGLRAHASISRGTPGPRRSTSCAGSASPTPSSASTTTRTSSPAGRSSGWSSPWRSSSTPA